MSETRTPEQIAAEALLAKIKALSAKQEQSRRFGPAQCRAEQLDAIASALRAASLQAEGVREMYHELLYAVERKYRGETRHETALRYIQEAERRSATGSLASAASHGEEDQP